MTLAQKQRIMPLAMATLCTVVGIMSLLFVVYYANAINNQNQSRNQIATLQTQNADLQNQIATRDSQIASLNTQLSSLNTQLNTLTADKQNLQDQVNSLSDTVNTLSQQIAQLATMEQSPSRGGARAYMR
jgi:chromosome segregation ATPase